MPPDTPPQLTTVDSLVQLSFLVSGILERRAAEHGVSMTQARLLGVLRDREPTINQLAELLELDKSSTSGLVDRAERRGLVTRSRSTVDRRSVLVSLTAQGRKQVAEVAALIAADLGHLLETLPAADVTALTRIATALIFAHAGQRDVDLTSLAS